MHSEVKRNLRKLFQTLLQRINSEKKFGRFWSEFWLHHVQPNVIFRLWFILPFNGQSRRLFNFYVIANNFKPTIGIESGTYFGTSTYLFLGVPTILRTYSIESNPKFLDVARSRFHGTSYENRVEFVLGDSKIEISRLLSKLNPTNERVICYLDAHWEGDIPTLEEIRALQDWAGDWVAIVDDFFLPGELGLDYGFDQYGNKVLNAQIFDEISNLSILAPNESSELETGARRGTGYLFGGPNRLNYIEHMYKELNLKFLRT